MTATITLGISTSVVACDRRVLEVVRHHVAYQEAELPPPRLQAAIKGFLAERGRAGARMDVLGLRADPDLQRLAEAMSWDMELLTVPMLERVVQNRGAWDGWRTMVTAKGEFPTGLLAHVKRALEFRAGERWVIDDRRGPRPEPRGGWKVPSLFPFQAEAVESFLAAGQGVLDLPPRSGKTRTAVAIVARLGRPALYVAPTVGIATQTARAFREFFPDVHVHLATGRHGKGARSARERLPALVWVATPQTAIRLDRLDTREVLILDEVHHGSSDTYKNLADKMGAWWRLGLTGTHFRSDGRDLEMIGVAGRACYSRSVADMVDLGRLVPAKIAMLRLRIPEVQAGRTANEWYRCGVSECGPRTQLCAYAASTLAAAGKRVLVLTKEVEHARELARRIPGAVQVDGEDGDAVDHALQALANGRRKVVVGTSVIGEGRDVPVADALVYAAGGESPVKLIQDYYRVLTASPGKRYGIVVDIADAHHPVLLGHAVSRLGIYRQEASFTCEVLEVDQFEPWLATIART